MYHDTIKINFISHNWKEISFNYDFLISKNTKEHFSIINYGELLSKFKKIGFDIKYLKFNDIEETENVYCTYNYQPNFNIFFLAYDKILKNKHFNITFAYGVIINGKFLPNNMNTFAKISFADASTLTNSHGSPLYKEEVIKSRTFAKTQEFYQIVDKEGNIIGNESTYADTNFEQHFFEKYDIKVALRKYKLGRLKMFSEEND